MTKRLLALAEDVLSLPTAPFREHRIREFIHAFCKKRGIAVREDDFGNLVVRLGKPDGKPTLAFAAHMDHPGFIIESPTRHSRSGDGAKDSRNCRDGQRTTALFYGAVEEEYFAGEAVRVFADSGEVTARVTGTSFNLKKNIKRVRLEVSGPVKKGDTAMWDLPPFCVRAGKLSSRACDDLVGCISVLAMLDALARRRRRRHVLGVFTVAEEAGLNGARWLCMNRGLPKSVRLVAIETSREKPDARMGRGAVIRVGDRQTIFDPGMTAFMEFVAEKLKRRDKRFAVQRALMDGGTCETTTYQAFGYRAGAACVPLGNYHNRDFRRGKIAAEYISVDDLENMVKLFVHMVKHAGQLDRFLKPPTPRYREERRALGERLLW